jgi:hypothetical protein
MLFNLAVEVLNYIDFFCWEPIPNPPWDEQEMHRYEEYMHYICLLWNPELLIFTASCYDL